MLNTKQFSYVPSKKMFVGEMSEVQHGIERIYSDAADTGFRMVSHKTGAESVWYLNNTSTDNENEVISWEFKPTAETLRKIPALKGYSVIVFND